MNKLNNQKDDDFKEMADEWSDDNFEKAMKDLRDARKLNRQANVLSVVALIFSLIAVIIRILTAL